MIIAWVRHGCPVDTTVGTDIMGIAGQKICVDKL
jgi:hypothetical protein